MRLLLIVIACCTAFCVVPATTAQDAPTKPVVFETPAGKLTDLGLNAQGYREFRREKDSTVMVLVPGGYFQKRNYVGNPSIDGGAFQLHTEAFLIDKYEVTNSQVLKYLKTLSALKVDGDSAKVGETLLARNETWGLSIADGKVKLNDGLAAYPSVGTTGDLAVAYAKWVGGDLPWGFEWEKAAAGPSGLTFPWGEAAVDSTRANSFLHGPKHPMPVGSFADGVSPYGCFDMAGNVYDRCYWFETDKQIDPKAKPHMLRGGSWVSPHWANLRCVDRCAQPMDAAEGSVGFRCVIRDPKVLAAIGVESDPALRIHDDVQAAFAEASARNVPILLFLAFETCGQCDRTRAQVFTDPKFIEYVNQNAVLLVGHNPGHGVDDPIEPEEGSSILYPGCQAENLRETFDYFCYTVNTRVVPKQISEFSISPGEFVLNPHLELQERPDQMVLVGEADLPKSGNDPTAFIDALKRAQDELGTGQTRTDFLAGKPGPKTSWAPPEDSDDE
ncbi:MAG: SUMF1/EgtB/PvdO family nonheme iron enzyme [Planctomycetes bacterium]|nr:SUMF1/EgtB/PvdO family nonheme iron enzyme [Planctomycetota bacterium]